VVMLVAFGVFLLCSAGTRLPKLLKVSHILVKTPRKKSIWPIFVWGYFKVNLFFGFAIEFWISENLIGSH
jgi:hypothetical protein